MTPVEREAACVVRGLWCAAGRVRIVTRNLGFEAEGQTGLAAGARHPAALELLVAALVTDLIAGFQREARRAGVTIHDAELNVSADLENPLVALGVVGETGSAALRSVSGSLYVSCDPGAEPLEALWQRALARAPVYATLARSATLDIDLKPVS